mgnify:CR=1 FL=1
MLGVEQVLRTLLISLLRTEVLLIGTLVGNVLRLAVGITLVYAGFGWVGAALGYLLVSLANLFVSLAYAWRSVGIAPTLSLAALTDVLRAGVVSWLPSIVVLAGQWLGVLFVFGTGGAVETGHYYVAQAISFAVINIAASILGLMLPLLSGMPDGRKRASSRAMKISLVFMVPVAVFVAAYPWLPLALLGEEYLAASTTLTTLLLSAFVQPITASVNSLVYAYGFYRLVLAIGLSINIPRILLYLLLVPMYGGLGAAISFTAGSYCGLLSSLAIARRVGFRIDARTVGTVIGIPLLLGALSRALELHWLLGLILTASSYVAYTKLGILTRKDLKDILTAFVSRERISKLYTRLRPIIDLVLP